MPIVSIALVNDPALKGKIGELSLVTTAVAGSFDASNTLLTQVVVTDKDPVAVTVGEKIQTVTYSGLPQFYQIDAVDANGTALREGDANGYDVKYYDLMGNAVAEPVDAGTYNVVIETVGTAALLAGHAGNTVGSPYQLVIEPAPLTVSGISKDYDGTTALGNALTRLAGVTLDGFVNGEGGITVAGFSGAFAAATAGATTFELGAVQTAVSAGASAREGNYTVQTGRVPATINKVTPTLTLGNLTQAAGSVTAVTATAAPAGSGNDTAQILVEYEIGGVWKTFQEANLNSITTDSSISVRASIPAETENFNATGYVTGTLRILGASNPNPGTGTIVVRTWTVTFESNGGTTIEALQVTRGSRITLTQKPEKPGYTFVGWCTDKELTKRVTSLTVNANTILYAEWSADGSAHAAYLAGYGNGIFAPDAKLTRAEAVTILYRLTDETFSGPTLSFTDVKPGAWYYDAVTAMASAGYVYGYPDDTFRPDEPITRAEFAAMLSRYSSGAAASTSYSDVRQDAWYATSIGKVTQLGWMIGRDGEQFHPEANLTRAETAAALNRVLGRSADRSYISQNRVNPYLDVSTSHWAFYDIVEASVNHLFETAASGAETWSSTPSTLDSGAIGSSGNYIP